MKIPLCQKAATVIALLSLGLLAACSKAAAPPALPIWAAYRGDIEVLRCKEGSGPLRSTALLPVGVEPPVHPFLTATALVPEEESALFDILKSSNSFPDFMERLKKAGYDVRPDTVSP